MPFEKKSKGKGHQLVSERFKAALKNIDITQQELSERTGISVRTISRISSKGLITAATAEAIAPTLNVSDSFLRGRTDDPSPPGEATTPLTIIATPEPQPQILGAESLTWVPVISPQVSVSAGEGNGCEDVAWDRIEDFPLFDGKIAALHSANGLLGMYVEGDSMEPGIHDGDLVIFIRTDEWIPGSPAVICLDGKLLVKGIIRGPEGEICLRSQNRNYKDIVIGKGSLFLVFGRVIKIISMRDPKPVL